MKRRLFSKRHSRFSLPRFSIPKPSYPSWKQLALFYFLLPITTITGYYFLNEIKMAISSSKKYLNSFVSDIVEENTEQTVAYVSKLFSHD